MANQLLTTSMITREALRLFRNSNAFLQNVDRQYDDQFAKVGAKIGNTLRVRLPVDYVVGSGPTITPQNTVEQYTSLSITSQKNVSMSFSSVDMALSLDEFSKRIIAPAVNNLAGAVAADLMSLVDTGGINGTGGQGPAQHFVHTVDGNGNTITPTASTITYAGAILTAASAPEGPDKRIMVLAPKSEARIIPGLTIGNFNPQSTISDQYRTGLFRRDVLGFDIYHDITVLNHTTGSFSAGTINGAGQTGSVLMVNAITGTLNQGDVINVAGVSSVNRVTKVSTNIPREFVVTAAVPSGSTSIPVYPPLTPGNGAQAQYQTTDVSPANGAAITLVNKAGEVYTSNICFVPEAFTLATADLELPRGVHEAARETLDGISMRMVSQYNVLSDQFVTRLDILYGGALLRPEWVVRLADQQ